jgi:YD repeat-containing protein
VSVTSDSHTIEYLYDAQDKRVGKQLDGIVRERYIYDGEDIALVVNVMGTLIDR